MKKGKRLLSILLALAMTFALLFSGNVAAFADDAEENEAAEEIFAEEEPANEAASEATEETAEPVDAVSEENEPEEAPSEAILEEKASSGKCGDNVTWELTGTTLTISGTGEMWSFYSQDPTYEEYKDSILTVEIKKGVTNVGGYAFWNYKAIKRVTLPDGLLSIDVQAFISCTSLAEITIPSTVTSIGKEAFANCDALKNVMFKGKAPSMGTNIFRNVTATASYLPLEGWTSSVMQDYGGTITWFADNKIGDNVTWKLNGGTLTLSGTGNTYNYDSYFTLTPFDKYKEEIKSVDVKNGVTGIGEYVFNRCEELTSLTLPNSLTSIGEAAFANCTSLTSVTLPSNLKSLGEGAFYGCTSLKSVTLPSGLTKLEESVFEYCTSLASITLPSGLKSIGNYAFYGCTSLASITLPSGLESIGYGAFILCKSFTEINIPASVAEIGPIAFNIYGSLFKKITVDSSNQAFASVDGILFSKQKTRLICYPSGKTGSSYKIPEGTEVIGTGAFAGSQYLETVTIPSGVVLDGEAIFHNCEKLRKVTLSEGLQEIPANTFSACASLAEVIIPSTVTKIGNYAFGNNSSLKAVYFKGAPPTMSAYTFNLVTATAYYPEALIDQWTESFRLNYGGTLTWVARHVDVTAMKFDKTTLEIPVGKTVLPEVIFTPEDGYAILTWKSSAPAVASVDENGYVTAKKVGKTTISASAEIGGKTVTIKCTVNVLFKDVTNKSYAPYTAIYALNEQGIVAGFSDGTFKPNDPVTRGQVLVFLWRSAGKPEPKSSKITFKDADTIKALGTQYVKAVLWGVEQGITEGFTDNTFRPNQNCTRGQIVTFLWRYKKKPAPKSGYTGSFPDVPKTHTFYKAVSWAASYKITTGFSDGTFGPSKECTRGQCVAFIYRMLNL